MLKAIHTKNFEAEPCYYKDMLHLSRNYEKAYSLIYVKSTEIDELILLLQNAKLEFREYEHYIS